MRSSRILARSVEEIEAESAMSDVELTPVRDAHKFDEPALEQYLQTHVEGFQGPMEIKQFKIL